MTDVYVANAMFGDADRAFNRDLAAKLRERQLTVFLPQETDDNLPKITPTADGIFVSDTQALLASDVVLAVLDQETIDCGVACEIGVAFGSGIPVIGLLTDFRQFREGEGRIYKNLYVIGAIERNGRLCRSVHEAVAACASYLAATRPQQLDRHVRNTYERARSTFATLVDSLETWYDPTFDSAAEIIDYLRDLRPRTVLDVGCGDGRLGQAIAAQFPGTVYAGVDPVWHGHSSLVSYGDIDAVPEATFDAAVLGFVLHDVWDRDHAVDQLLTKIVPGGRLIILDLTRDDLPALVRALRIALRLGPPTRDPRLALDDVSRMARRRGLVIDDCRAIHRRFRFPNRQSFILYAETFGLPVGLDLPSLVHSAWTRSVSAEHLADSLRFPHTDDRWFLKCLLTTPRSPQS